MAAAAGTSSSADRARTSSSGDGGDDSLDGGSANNRLYGGSGNDTMTANQGSNDKFYGGSGFDTVTYANFTAGVVVNVHTGTGNSGAHAQPASTTIEKVIGSNLARHDDLQQGRNNLRGRQQRHAHLRTRARPCEATMAWTSLNGANGFSDVFWLQFNKGPDTANNFVSGEDKLLR